MNNIILFTTMNTGPICLSRLCESGFAPSYVVPPGQNHVSREAIIKTAHSYNIPVLMFKESPSEPGFIDLIRERQPELIIVCSFPHLIPQAVYECATKMAINAHPSLLPEYRGANPYYHVIANGEQETGITFHLLDRSFDTGDIVMQKKVPLYAHDTMGTLANRLDCVTAEQLVGFLEQLKTTGMPISRQQDQVPVNKAPRVGPWDINWALSCAEIERRVRALNPFYFPYSKINETVINILSGVDMMNRDYSGTAGEVVEFSQNGIDVATGVGVYRITSLQYGNAWMGAVKGLKEHGFIKVGDQFVSDKRLMVN